MRTFSHAIPGLWLLAAGVACADKKFGNFTYVEDGNTIRIIDYPEDATGTVAIPATIAGKPVTSIGWLAFFNCREITGVTIPPGVTSIGESAFVNCFKMVSVNIPSGVTVLERNAFGACAALESITLPVGLKSIGDQAFINCAKLTAIEVPASVTHIGNTAFSGCTDLVVVSLSPNLAGLGFDAFSYCPALKQITIPEPVTALGASAFLNCGSLEVVNFKGEAPELGLRAFEGVSPSFKVTYRKGKAGFTSPVWNGFPSESLGDDPFPEISVKLSSGRELVHGGGTNLGTVGWGKSTTASLKVTNVGTETLSGLALAKSGAQAGDFTVGSLSSTSLEPGKSLTLNITFRPAASGQRVALLQIASNDKDENPFDIPLKGAGGLAPQDITVMEPVGNVLVYGDSKKSLGNVKVKTKGDSKTFTIRNDGEAVLGALGVVCEGVNAGDFIITKPAKTSLSAGTATTFKVTLRPTAKGVRQALLRIRSNDPDEKSFDIKLTGLGI